MTAVPEPLVPGSVSRRKLLQASVGCLCIEAGFQSVNETALETLTEMMQSCKYIRLQGLKILLDDLILSFIA